MITVIHTLRFLARCDRKILNKLCFKSISWRDNNFDGVRIIVTTARLVLVALPTRGVPFHVTDPSLRKRAPCFMKPRNIFISFSLQCLAYLGTR